MSTESRPAARPEMTAMMGNERATPSLVYRALLQSIREGDLQPGAKLPNERDLAAHLQTSRTAVRAALAMMERQGLVDRRVGSGTFLTEDARSIFDRMDQTAVDAHDTVPSLLEIAEGRLLFEPAMMHLVVSRVEPDELEQMKRTLARILEAPTWRQFKEEIYDLHRQIFAGTKNRFLMQIMQSILSDRRAVAFDGRESEKPAPRPVREQTHRELSAIVGAIEAGDAPRAEELTSDHLMRTLATINIWH